MAAEIVPLRANTVHILPFDFSKRIARILADTGEAVTLDSIVVVVDDSAGEDVTESFIHDGAGEGVEEAPWTEGAKGFAWKRSGIPTGTYTVVCTGTFSDGQTFDLSSASGELPNYVVTD